MGGRYLVGILLVVIFLVVPIIEAGQSSSSNWAPWGKSFNEKETKTTESSESLPVVTKGMVTKPTQEKDPEKLVANYVDNFNERYGYNIDYPKVTFIDSVRGEYSQGTIYLPEVSRYAIAHESCHYFQDKTCKFEGYGESFCEVFAKSNRSEDECLEKGWPYYYCHPFRLEEVNRQAFVDCVFKDCENKISKEELLNCYEENKK